MPAPRDLAPAFWICVRTLYLLIRCLYFEGAHHTVASLRDLTVKGRRIIRQGLQELLGFLDELFRVVAGEKTTDDLLGNLVAAFAPETLN